MPCGREVGIDLSSSAEDGDTTAIDSGEVLSRFMPISETQHGVNKSDSIRFSSRKSSDVHLPCSWAASFAVACGREFEIDFWLSTILPFDEV